MIPPKLFFGLLLILSLSLPAQAAVPDVSGAWKWTFERNGESREISMKIQQDGPKVAGTVTGPDGNSADIREGKIAEDGKLAFMLQIERDGNTIKVNFEGQAKGDTITGKTKYVNAEGEQREREWVAKREKKADLTGKWASVFKRQDGTPMESTLVFKQDGEKLTGKQEFNGNETEITEGKAAGGEVTFRIVRERDGRTVTAKYRGKLQDAKTIKGQIESDWSGEVRKMDWEARKE